MRFARTVMIQCAAHSGVAIAPPMNPVIPGKSDRIWNPHQPYPSAAHRLTKALVMRASAVMELKTVWTMKKSSTKLKGMANIHHTDAGAAVLASGRTSVMVLWRARQYSATISKKTATTISAPIVPTPATSPRMPRPHCGAQNG